MRCKGRDLRVFSLCHISGKKSRSKSELPSWFCKGPSSCAFCCRNSGVVVTTRSQSGSTKASAGRKTKPPTRAPDSPAAFSSFAESKKSTTLLGPLRDLLAKLCCLFDIHIYIYIFFYYYFFFFSVHGKEMCAESLWFETGSLQSSDNDTWQVQL